MRHRARSSKIKYEHSMIPGLRELLESLEEWDEITSIIPARIKPIRSRGKHLRVEVKYRTRSGLKALVKGATAVQEVFFVTNQPLLLQIRLDSAL